MINLIRKLFDCKCNTTLFRSTNKSPMSIKLYSYCNQRCLWHVYSTHFQMFVYKQCRKFIFVRLFIHIVNIFFGKKALSFLWFFYQKNNISLVYRKKAIFLSDTHFLSWGKVCSFQSQFGWDWLKLVLYFQSRRLPVFFCSQGYSTSLLFFFQDCWLQSLL